MKEQNTKRTEMPLEDAGKIIRAIEGLEGIGITEISNHMAIGLKFEAAARDYRDHPVEALSDEAYFEGVVLDLLTLIGKIEAKNDGQLYFPKFSMLTGEEKLELESRRIHARAVDLLGDKKEIEAHRRNLRRAFEDTEDPNLLKTWEALDAQLEADIKYTKSLLTPQES